MSKMGTLVIKRMNKDREQKCWEEKREEAIKTGCYNWNETKRIKLAIKDNEIKKWLKENKSDVYFEAAKEGLRSGVYFKKVENNKKKLINHLFHIDYGHREQFPKLFWEEYVYKHSVYNDCSYKQYNKEVKELFDIKGFLDRRPKYQGISGDAYQNNGLYGGKDIRMKFSMRAWGALMAAYMNSKKKKRLYSYIDYYM